ncbi:MAG: hypothetical protein GY934_00870, partial [Gammaproteobacteria bacterium]|nr:hypothetical protein [Gammaproteobacteria bacterium]
PTVFESASTYYTSATTLQNGNVLISYTDNGNSNYGTFVIYDPAGNEVVAPTVFESAAAYYISATTLQNGNILISYRDDGNSGYGTFVIYGSAGTEFTSELAVTTKTEEGYNLFDIMGSTTATSAAITQLGTGDIFTLDNASGRQFTVTNNGYIGIGTSSPAYDLDIYGDARIDGHLYDSAGTNGTPGYVMQTTATGITWVATSSLGIGGGATALEGLSDVSTMTETLGDLLYWNGSAWADIATSSLGLGDGTLSGLSGTLAVNQGGTGLTTYGGTDTILYTTAADTLASNSTFVFDGTNLGIGTANPNAMLDIYGTSNALRLSYDGSNYTELSVDSGGQLNISSTGGSASTMTLGSGLAEDIALLMDGNAIDFYTALDDTDDTFKIGTGSTIGASTLLSLDAGTTTIHNTLYASSSATSTFNNGIKLVNGCFEDSTGTCLKTAGDTQVVVAASDTDSTRAAYADYVADGTNDEVEIQAAIDAVYAGGGGTVHLLEGSFSVSNQIDLATSTRLLGQGLSTILTLANSSPNNIALLSAEGINSTHVGHLRIEGNRAGNTNDNQNGISYINTSSSSIEYVQSN